jgi:hypothetical protein
MKITLDAHPSIQLAAGEVPPNHHYYAGRKDLRRSTVAKEKPVMHHDQSCIMMSSLRVMQASDHTPCIAA